MPRRRCGSKYRTISERIQKDPDLCNVWTELNKNKIGKPYKNKKDCLAFQKKMTKIVKGNLTANQKKKQNKTKDGTRRR